MLFVSLTTYYMFVTALLFTSHNIICFSSSHGVVVVFGFIFYHRLFSCWIRTQRQRITKHMPHISMSVTKIIQTAVHALMFQNTTTIELYTSWLIIYMSNYFSSNRRLISSFGEMLFKIAYTCLPLSYITNAN